MNYYDIIFAQQKAKKDSKYFGEISDAINVLAGTETTYTPSEMAPAIIDAIPTETASGNPIHITDAAAYPAESVVTTLEPVQELHGYDKPWPAGGGKNLLPLTIENLKAINTSGTWSGNTYVHKNVTFDIQINPSGAVVGVKVNGTATNGMAFLILLNSDGIFATLQNGTSYDMNGCPQDGSSSTYCIAYTNMVNAAKVDAGTGVTINSLYDSETYPSQVIRLQVNENIAISNLTFYPMIRLATDADATFEPYSNECPISGHTGVELTRTGKNLLDDDTVQIGIAWNGNHTSDRARYVIPCEPSTTYTLSMYGTNNLDLIVYGFYADIPALAGNVAFPQTFTTNTDSKYIVLGLNKADITKSDVENLKLQLELGSTATTYEPYTPEAHSITFPQAQSPVYGCEVDWVNGVLIIKDVKETRIWRDREGTQLTNVIRGVFVLQNLTVPVNERNTEKMCNVAPYKAVYSEDTVHFYVQTDANNREARAYVFLPTNTDENTEIEICYPLATPLEIPLTPEVITLLKGENNVWTDAGTSEIEYKVDLQSYIQKLIEESSASASALSVSPLSLGKSAVLTSTDGDEADEIKEVDEPAEESKEAEDLTAKKEIAKEPAETEKVEDVKETEEYESEVEE